MYRLLTSYGPKTGQELWLDRKADAIAAAKEFVAAHPDGVTTVTQGRRGKMVLGYADGKWVEPK